MKLSGSVLSAGSTFTQADVDAGLLTYDHFGGESPTDSFAFDVNDGVAGSTTVSDSFDIAITQVNDVPIIGSIPPEDLVEDGFASGTLASFVTDNDPGFTHTYSLVTDTVNGELTLNPDGSFTYQPDPNYFGADSFEFIVDDGAGGTDTATYNFNVTPVNDDVSLDVNAGETFAEASVGNVISNLRLETTDVDNSESEIQYTVTTSTTRGELKLGGSVLSAGSTFTQADVDAGLLTYDHFGGESPTDSFAFDVNDGVAGSTTVSDSFDIAITQVNDVPIIGSIPPEDLVEDGV